ncbi:MAG: hypothetical protein DRR19_07700 [Candidatus Parabeggiatoa sp. nov. 1]|nr:MAG: hypothetical protein DRR19_07700 [Gammaproteobacteria bacterium]
MENSWCANTIIYNLLFSYHFNFGKLLFYVNKINKLYQTLTGPRWDLTGLIHMGAFPFPG